MDQTAWSLGKPFLGIVNRVKPYVGSPRRHAWVTPLGPNSKALIPQTLAHSSLGQIFLCFDLIFEAWVLWYYHTFHQVYPLVLDSSNPVLNLPALDTVPKAVDIFIICWYLDPGSSSKTHKSLVFQPWINFTLHKLLDPNHNSHCAFIHISRVYFTLHLTYFIFHWFDLVFGFDLSCQQ